MATQEKAPTRYIRAEGIQYAYRLIGPDHTLISIQPPLLMLNHYRSTIDLWDPYLINNFTQTHNRTLITYDYAGIGHSSGPVATTIAGMGNDLIAFLNVLMVLLKIRQVDVLGFSIGGIVAQQLVLTKPEVVNKMVLAASSPSLGPDVERPRTDVQSAIMTSELIPSAVLAAFFPAFLVGTEGQAWLNRSLASRTGIAGTNGEPEVATFVSGTDGKLQNLTRAFLGWDADHLPYALLQKVQKDVLVTSGQNDVILPPRKSHPPSN